MHLTLARISRSSATRVIPRGPHPCGYCAIDQVLCCALAVVVTLQHWARGLGAWTLPADLADFPFRARGAMTGRPLRIFRSKTAENTDSDDSCAFVLGQVGLGCLRLMLARWAPSSRVSVILYSPLETELLQRLHDIVGVDIMYLGTVENVLRVWWRLYPAVI